MTTLHNIPVDESTECLPKEGLSILFSNQAFGMQGGAQAIHGLGKITDILGCKVVNKAFILYDQKVQYGN